MEKEKFNQTKYINNWAKDNMGTVSCKYKKEFVTEFKESCKKLGIKQSDIVRIAMQQTIDKAKGKD